MKEIIALQEYTDKYISLYEGEIRNIEDRLADQLIEKGIVAEHNESSGGGGGSSSSFDLSDRLAKGTDDQGNVVIGAVKQGLIKDIEIEIEGNTRPVPANIASGQYSHAEGSGTTASGSQSHAEGGGTKASGNQSHAEGTGTTASGYSSHAEGTGTKALGDCSHAEGSSTIASGGGSHAEGLLTNVSGEGSHAEGIQTISNHRAQHVFGEYNIVDSSSAISTSRGNYVEIVGNGTNNSRSNARTLDWSGNQALSGSLTLGKGTVDEVTITPAQLKALINLLS